jgi:NAD(P)-dependent dehydrogenase (short-subunit alcohol dehydrogenase family)
MTKYWFITGTARGLGLEIAKAALRAGDCVVATGRRREAVTDGLGPDHDRLLSLELDVRDATQARTAIAAARARFGAIDVLVNNAGYGHMGFFEEMAIADAQDQFATNVYGVFNVTWAALPAMRAARTGRIFNVSSLGGILGAQLGSFYCASKFAIEGFSECLAKEVAPFGLFVTLVEPGPFRTDFLTPESMRFGAGRIADYDDRRGPMRTAFEERNGLQPGDPVKLAEAIVYLANQPEPPLHFFAGSIAVTAATEKLANTRAEVERWRDLSVGTDGDFAVTNVEGLLLQIR